MIRSPFVLVLLLTLMAGTPSLPAQEGASLQERFMRGNIAYGNGDYPAAEVAYREVLREGRSAEVHYNLGNSLAQQDRWSEAAYHYLKATALNPHFEQAQANLLLARERLELEEPYPVLPRPARFLAEVQWGWLATLAFWLAVFFFFHPRFLPVQWPLRRTLGAACLLLLGLALATLVQHGRFAAWTVVSVPEVSLRVAPAAQSPGETRLKEGQAVRVIGNASGFNHVRTVGGDEGFILPVEVHPRGGD